MINAFQEVNGIYPGFLRNHVPQAISTAMETARASRKPSSSGSEAFP
jgi:hypothetical protein